MNFSNFSDEKVKLKATLKINGKKVKGKKITFKFKGKTYKVKTNKKGIAKVTIKKKCYQKAQKRQEIHSQSDLPQRHH